MKARFKTSVLLIVLVLAAFAVAWLVLPDGFGILQTDGETTPDAHCNHVRKANSKVNDGNSPTAEPDESHTDTGQRWIRIENDLGEALPEATLECLEGDATHDGYSSLSTNDSRPRRFDTDQWTRVVEANADGRAPLPDKCGRVIARAPECVPRLLLRSEFGGSRMIALTRTATAIVKFEAPDGFPDLLKDEFPLHLAPSFLFEWPRKDWGVPQAHPPNTGNGHGFTANGRGTTLRGLVPGLKYSVTPRQSELGFRTRVDANFELQPGEEREIVIVLPEGVWVEGRVLDEFGRALEGAEVKLVEHVFDNESGRLRGARSAGAVLTKSRGEFLLAPTRELLRGSDPQPVNLMVVVAHGNGPGQRDLALGAVRVTGDGVFDSGTLRLGEGGQLSGWVHDRHTGAVLADFPLDLRYGRLWSVDVNTDDTGFFRVTGLPKQIEGKPVRIRVGHWSTDYHDLAYPTQDIPYLPPDALDGDPVKLEFAPVSQFDLNLTVTGGPEDIQPRMYTLRGDRGGITGMSTITPDQDTSKGLTLPTSFFIRRGDFTSRYYSFGSDRDPPSQLTVVLTSGFKVVLEELPEDHGIAYLWIENSHKQKLTRDWRLEVSSGKEYVWVMPTGEELFLVAQMAGTREFRRLNLGVSASGAERRVTPSELLRASSD